MRITDPDVIKNGEKDLINAVKNDLDLDANAKILQNKMNAKTLSSKGGKIIVHNNKIAFQMNFTIEIEGSLIFDRQGNYIPDTVLNTDVQQDTQGNDNGVLNLNSDDQNSDEILNIDLPDYDLDDDLGDTQGIENIEQEDDNRDNKNAFNLDQLNDDDEFVVDELDVDELGVDEFGVDELGVDDLTGKNDEKLPPDELATDEFNPFANDNGMEDDTVFQSDTEIKDDDFMVNELQDDDINDILKESRDFWELKENG